jgi:glycosyltransferase involved in cell wall biosynthesis
MNDLRLPIKPDAATNGGLSTPAGRPIRILHVVGAMNQGGTETWLMHVLRQTDRDRFQMDFLVHTPRRAVYDDEIESLGSRILRCLHPQRPVRYARALARILREHGPYDVVHGHPYHYSGWVLRTADAVGVPVRIAHSHNDYSRVDSEAPLLRRCYLALTRHWIARHATHGLAASEQAASSLFGPDWRSDPRWQVLYCGIHLPPFRQHVDQKTVRAELNIPADAFVVGHVGRFQKQKNHAFLVNVAKETARRHPNVRLLLIGDGPLRPAVERQVAESGLADRVIFAGLRPDVARLMLGAMDAFVLPSLHEGLGLVLVEAQAAGLPCILTDSLPEEVDLVRPLVRRLSLSESPSTWADAVSQMASDPSRIAQAEALAVVERSPFNIGVGVETLETFYDRTISPRAAA